MFIKATNQFFKCHVFKKVLRTSIRTLYSPESLGLAGYIRTKERAQIQFKDVVDKFKDKMTDYVSSDSNIIFTEDLKHMVHLVEPREEDINLVKNMMIKFVKQNNELRFGSFIFGPVIMRMYHHLNKPKEALEAFKTPELEGFFDQLVSFQILMDLLFTNELYQEVLNVFEIIQTKQLKGSKYPKNCVVLVLAACYKLNTDASFNYAKNLWTELTEVGHYPMRRAATFMASLALKRNSPAIALEVLTSLRQQSYVTIRNLKVSALADLGRPDDAFPILRSVMENDSPTEKKHTFCTETLDSVRKSVTKVNNKDIQIEFDRLERELISLGHIKNEAIDNLLCAEISSFPILPEENRMETRKVVQSKRKTFQRPGLSDLL